jgi:hypothetical protein
MQVDMFSNSEFSSVRVSMRVADSINNNSGRSMVLLAPPQERPVPLTCIIDDERRHTRLLAAAQRLRGGIYLGDGAITPDRLTPDGRHVQKDDSFSWHLLTVNQHEDVYACMRFRAHGPGVEFSDLAVSQSSASETLETGPKVRQAVQADMEEALRLGFRYVELGGWAIQQELRCTTEAVRMLLMTFGLAKLMGGADGLSTATTRHHSSSILRRLGGRPLMLGLDEMPPYYDSRYGCEMELLRFDSTAPNPRYTEWIQACCEMLIGSPVISHPAVETDISSIMRLATHLQN